MVSKWRTLYLGLLGGLGLRLFGLPDALLFLLQLLLFALPLLPALVLLDLLGLESIF
jgi:hypothetical protein